MAEYAAAYGGPPSGSMAWPLFLALLERAPRFDTRRRLHVLDGVAEGITAAFEGGAEIGLRRDELVQAAYPFGQRVGDGLIPNLAQLPEPAS